MICDHYAGLNLVTTIHPLADPVNEKDADFYRREGKEFRFVGPCLDEPRGMNPEFSELFKEVEEASAAKREVFYVSMGTVVTGDHPDHGWHACSGTALTGKQVCQAIYKTVFQVLGDSALTHGCSWDTFYIFVVLWFSG